MSNWIVVVTYPARAMAEMAAELLRDQGVEAFVAVDDAGGLRPELALTLGAKVRVHPDDAERARLILENMRAPEDD